MSTPRRIGLIALIAGLFSSIPVFAALAYDPEATDPARNVALPCEAVSTPGLVARTSKDIVHVANVCGFVGTDVELQSRTDTTGKVHDYAFVGTMGGGPRIFDVTDPAHPKHAGGYTDSGWENDIQVGGNVMVSTFDGVNGEDSSASNCLKTRYPNANGQGVDIYRLDFNELTATFEVNLLTCVANPPGGAHNATLHNGGDWLGISNCCSDWAIDVVDLENVMSGTAVHRYRFIDESKATADRCPAGAAFKCVVMKQPNGSSARGLWRPHDIHFSRDGKTAYIAAINSTWIVDVSQVLNGKMRAIAIIPNELADGVHDINDISISHQSDVTSDGKLLIVTDEEGGGLTNTDCNTDSGGIIGAMHFWALAPIAGVPASKGAKPSAPKRLGAYVNPNPNLGLDPLAGAIAALPRPERACTVHVFRAGGDGSTSPGELVAGYGGVSTQPITQLTTAWYGAGVWRVDFSGPPSNTDGIAEDSRTTWGNTLGWNIMPGADTWSGKEYKGYIYAGDILRGFDVYRIAG